MADKKTLLEKGQNYFDTLTRPEAYGTRHTGNPYIDAGITGASDLGAGAIGLLSPLVHPLNTIKSMGRNIVSPIGSPNLLQGLGTQLQNGSYTPGQAAGDLTSALPGIASLYTIPGVMKGKPSLLENPEAPSFNYFNPYESANPEADLDIPAFQRKGNVPILKDPNAIENPRLVSHTPAGSADSIGYLLDRSKQRAGSPTAISGTNEVVMPQNIVKPYSPSLGQLGKVLPMSPVQESMTYPDIISRYAPETRNVNPENYQSGVAPEGFIRNTTNTVDNLLNKYLPTLPTPKE